MKKILASSLVLAAAALTVSTAVLAAEKNTPAQDAFNQSQGYTPEQIEAFKKYRDEAITNGYNKEQTDAIKKEAAENGRTIDPSVDLQDQVDQVRTKDNPKRELTAEEKANLEKRLAEKEKEALEYEASKAKDSSSSEASSSSSDSASKETKSTEVAVNEAKKAAKAAAKEGQKVLPNTAAVK